MTIVDELQAICRRCKRFGSGDCEPLFGENCDNDESRKLRLDAIPRCQREVHVERLSFVGMRDGDTI